jgi:hypothetical protein
MSLPGSRYSPFFFGPVTMCPVSLQRATCYARQESFFQIAGAVIAMRGSESKNVQKIDQIILE